VLYSEIDPALHATGATAFPLNYKPKYYLINGHTYAPGQAVPVITAGKAKKKMLIRFLNAGLMTHIPVLQGSHMMIVAEDGNRYPYPKQQYSMLLTAGKTLDALWFPVKKGTHALYDRRLSLTYNGAAGGGMLVYLDVGKAFPWVMFNPAFVK
jgi:hypothetical protein